jgi:hypothetical protein
VSPLTPFGRSSLLARRHWTPTCDAGAGRTNKRITASKDESEVAASARSGRRYGLSTPNNHRDVVAVLRSGGIEPGMESVR